MIDSLSNLKNATKQVLQGGGENAVQRHTSKGKLLARDRINLLLDKNTAFLELSTLAGYNMYESAVNSGGIVTGIGRIHG